MTDSLAELAEAIRSLRHELAQHTDDEARYAAAIELVELLMQHDRLTDEAPSEAISVASWAVSLAGTIDPEDVRSRVVPLVQLATAYMMSAAHDGEQALRTAANYVRQQRCLATDDDRAQLCAQCGSMMAMIATELREPDYFEEAIADLTVASELLSDVEQRDGVLFTRATLCAQRYLVLGGEDSDRQCAVETFTDALTWPEMDPEFRDHCRGQLISLILAEGAPATLRNSDRDPQQALQRVRNLSTRELTVLKEHLDALSADATKTPPIAVLRIWVAIALGGELTQHGLGAFAQDLDTLAEDLQQDPSRHKLMAALREAVASGQLPEAPPESFVELNEQILEMAKGTLANLFGIEDQPDVDLCEFASKLLDRAELTEEDPGGAIAISELLLEGPEPTPGARILPIYQLGVAHSMRGMRGSDEDLRLGAEFLCESIQMLLTVPELFAEDIGSITARSGSLIEEIALRLDEPTYLDIAITSLDASVGHLEDGEPRRQAWIARASLYSARFSLSSGSAADRQRAIDEFTEALQWDDSSVQIHDATHISLAFLLLFKRRPVGLSLDNLAREGVDSLVNYVNFDQVSVVEQHLAELSDNFPEADRAALRLQIRRVKLLTNPDNDTESFQHEILRVLEDVISSSGDEALGQLTDADLEVVETIRASLEDCQTDADMERLIASAIAGLPFDSILRDHLVTPQLLTGARGATSEQELTNLIRRLEQRVNALPFDAPERADELLALAVALAGQVGRKGANSSPEAVARMRQIAEQLLEYSPRHNIAVGIGHSLLALTPQEPMHMSLEDLDARLNHASLALESLPDDHELRPEVKSFLADLLFRRFLHTDNYEDAEAHGHYAGNRETRSVDGLRRILSSISSVGVNDPEVAAERLSVEFGGAMSASQSRLISRTFIALWLLRSVPVFADLLPSEESIDSRLEELDGTLHALDRALSQEEDPTIRAEMAELRQAMVDSHASLAETYQETRTLIQQYRERPTIDVDLDSARRELDEAQAIPESREEYFWETAGAAILCAALGMIKEDSQLADRGLAALDEVGQKQSLPELIQRLSTLLHALGRDTRYASKMTPENLQESISAIEPLLHVDHSFSKESAILHILASRYRQSHDPQRAPQTYLQALQVQARAVLLQSSPQRAMRAATAAGNDAVGFARYCLDCDQLEVAVQVLELGRGLVLYAASATASMPELLRRNGNPELAVRWETEIDQQQPWDNEVKVKGASAAGNPLPSDLRQQVLRELEGSAVEQALLSPPGTSEIGAALQSRGAQALVYLIEREAVVVTEDGAIQRLSCPELHEYGPVQNFDQLQQELARIGEAAEQPWQTALEDVCDWAWEAAVGPILERFGTTDRPRIVLVPTGKFTVVPWHAARHRRPDGTLRYACHEAILCYAASARQFLEATHRQPRSWTDKPVLVRAPELYWTEYEIGHIHDAHYSNGNYLGRPAAGCESARNNDDQAASTPEEVLAELPGASLLHLSCHARAAEVPVESELRLQAGRCLAVRDILRTGQSEDAALVVLATCVSDLTNRHHDEVLTLATAFLAAGASGVIGTKWEIADVSAAMFMIVFHHYLNTDYPDPATALRAAQLWMLDDNRQPIPNAPEKLIQYFTRIDPTSPMHWAAFAYHGR